MIKTELQSRSFGTAYDPVLNGIARGLADLFPLIEEPSSFAKASDPQDDFTDEQDEDRQ